LARGGADVATFYETAGPGGLLDGAGVFPLYHVFADLAGCGGESAELLDADDPLAAGGLVCGRVAVVANFTDRPQTVQLPDDLRPRGVRRLDASTASDASNDPEGFRTRWGPCPGPELDFAPYAVVTLDLGEGGR
jgi:hypothetical protein